MIIDMKLHPHTILHLIAKVCFKIVLPSLCDGLPMVCDTLTQMYI